MIRKPGAVRGMEVADRNRSTEIRTGSSPHPAPTEAFGLHDLVLEQALQTPLAPAIQQGERSISYGELRHQVDALASRLIEEGIGRGDLVGIVLTHTIDAIVAMLATMRCGAAYLPLDFAQPAVRLEEIIADADLALVLVDTTSESQFTWIACPQLSIDDVSQSDEFTLAPSIADESDLAYVIYTSGTTGRPKGVQVTHAGAVYSTRTRIEYYREPPGRFLLLSPITFDSSVAGIYWTLATGGELIIPDCAPSEAAVHLHMLIGQHSITHLLCIASLWNQVLGAATDEQLKSLEVVIVAGEACPPRLPANHFARLPYTRLFNEYGPTEATVWCSVEEIMPDANDQLVSIGRAIEGSRIYLLDEDRRPVVHGEAGEIYVAGAGIAAGYRNRAELTAERFISNPIENGRFSRMYRTGDLGRFRADGKLEFLGRRDEQVKIRGYRIELGEIESCLMRHHDVAEAVVVAFDQRLIAFWTAQEGASAKVEQSLDRWVGANLPEYMRPTRYICLDEFPRTGHGKIDRPALEAIATRSPREKPTSTVVAQSPLESELLEIFRAVLDRPVGIDDDFFRHGGDSLNAIDLIARIEQRWQRTVMLHDLMKSPSVASLARLLEGNAVSEIQPGRLIRLREGESTAPLVLLPPGGGGLVCYLELIRELRTSRSVYGIQARGLEDDSQPDCTVAAMVDYYLDLLDVECPTGEVHLAGWSFGGVVSYALAARMEAEGRPPASVTMLDCGMVYSFYVLRRLFPDQEIPLYLLNSADRDQFVSYFLTQGTDAGIVPPGASEKQARRILDVFAAGIGATADYRPSGYAGKLHLLAAKDRWCEPRRTPEREWAKVSDQLVTQLVPGDHLTMLRSPNVVELARALDGILNVHSPN